MRWKWEPGSVAFWDNRVVAHRAVPGGYEAGEREGKRTAVFGERPVFDGVRGVRLSEYRGKVEEVEGEREGDGVVKGVVNGVINGGDGVEGEVVDGDVNRSNRNVGP